MYEDYENGEVYEDTPEIEEKLQKLLKGTDFEDVTDELIIDALKNFVRPTTITVKVSVAEKESIKDRAELEGMSLNEWMYHAIAAKMSKDYNPEEAVKDQKILTFKKNKR